MASYFDQAPLLCFASSDDGTLLEVNERLCASLGYGQDELTGQKIDLILTLPARIFQQTHFFPLLKIRGQAEEIFITLRKKDGGQLPVLINAERRVIDGTPVNLHAGIIVQNRKKFEEELIAARKAAEAALHENTALLQAKEELQRHAEKLDRQIELVGKQNEELRQFNRVVTHNVQEPIRKLSVFSNMLLEQDVIQDQKKTVERIRQVTEQMKEVISGLQRYVWLSETPVRRQRIALDGLLQQLTEELKAEHPGVELILEVEAAAAFSADAEQMHQLFYQLLSNAIRYRKEGDGARVSVSAHTLQLNRFRNVAGKYQYIDFLRIRVQDKGIGLDPQYKDRIFSLFTKLHSQSGRGVGLSLCKRIVDNHGGSISIDGRVGEGTTVTLVLPLDNTEDGTLQHEQPNASRSNWE